MPLVNLNYSCPTLDAIPVHSSRDWGFIALLPVEVLKDSLKISFGYQWVSGISRVQQISQQLLKLINGTDILKQAKEFIEHSIRKTIDFELPGLTIIKL